MLFYGRLLASNPLGDIWQEGELFWLQLRGRQVTLSMSREEVYQLMELLHEAQRAEAQEELRKDEIRRLQIARARIADRIERAKARPKDAESKGN